MSDDLLPPGVRPGSGTPFTARGRSVAYAPPPWRMRGRTLALWYRLADPREARRHVPSFVEMDEDPVVRARFWDMQHDAVPAHEGDGPRWTRFREAVVAFPVRYEDVEGDLPTYMYADDPVYVAFGREVMGWPVRGGHIELEPGEPAVPAPGQRLAGRLVRHGRAIMEMRIELTGRIVALDDEAPPRWLAWKVIPDVAHAAAALSQLVVTGPERIHHRRAWEATASLAFAEGPEDELHHLRPREIVAAQLWTEVDLTIGWGRVLRDLRDSGEPRGDEAPTGG